MGVHSGLPYKSAADLPSAFAAMRGDAGPLGLRSGKSRGAANDGPRIRTIVFHGDADNIVHPSNAASVVGTAKEGESIERAEARNTAARAHTRTVARDMTGKVVVDQWLILGSGACLVRRQPGWHLHRSARSRCLSEMLRTASPWVNGICA